jgi:hypothetical protein
MVKVNKVNVKIILSSLLYVDAYARSKIKTKQKHVKNFIVKCENLYNLKNDNPFNTSCSTAWWSGLFCFAGS